MLENSIMSEMRKRSAGTRLARFSRKNVPTGAATSSQIVRSSENSKFEVPTIDTRARYGDMFIRHPEDRKYIKPYDALDGKPYKPKIPQLISRDPSYTHFKVPFQMACKERYNNSIKKYEDQFGHEIRSLIDNQPTAREATYLVRVVSYTTLWPPYHNENELNHTCRNFYRLTPLDNKRFQYIMTHDFS